MASHIIGSMSESRRLRVSPGGRSARTSHLRIPQRSDCLENYKKTKTKTKNYDGSQNITTIIYSTVLYFGNSPGQIYFVMKMRGVGQVDFLPKKIWKYTAVLGFFFLQCKGLGALALASPLIIALYNYRCPSLARQT